MKKEIEELLSYTGDSICNLIEQMEKGNWVDDHEHDVRMNVHMMEMAKVLTKLGEFRHEHLGYTKF